MRAGGHDPPPPAVVGEDAADPGQAVHDPLARSRRACPPRRSRAWRTGRRGWPAARRGSRTVRTGLSSRCRGWCGPRTGSGPFGRVADGSGPGRRRRRFGAHDPAAALRGVQSAPGQAERSDQQQPAPAPVRGRRGAPLGERAAAPLVLDLDVQPPLAAAQLGTPPARSAVCTTALVTSSETTSTASSADLGGHVPDVEQFGRVGARGAHRRGWRPAAGNSPGGRSPGATREPSAVRGEPRRSPFVCLRVRERSRPGVPAAAAGRRIAGDGPST